MQKKVLFTFGTLLLLAFCWQPNLLGQTATLSGTITDGATKEPLPFVNVGIPTQGIGATTELDGTYRITNITPGTYTVEVSYLGYATVSRELTFVAGGAQEFSLAISEGEGVNLAEVVVTGQAEGQRAAINQQINSNTIVNVVSKERLQELPDQNAAESVGRLSGVSVIRDAGEGQRIAVRGISPRLNNITVNGQRLPSTQENDRSTDLSMISPDMLEGIELYKALTPDRDGDAIGGSVNFTIAKAREGMRGVVRLMGTYNGLARSANNYRANLSLSNRFGQDNRFGYIITGNYQQIDRSREFQTVGYESTGTNTDGTLKQPIADLQIGYTEETRTRGGGSLTFDFSPSKKHEIMLNSTLGFTERDRSRYRRRFRVSTSEQRYDLREVEQSTTVLSNALSGEHLLGNLEIDWSASYNLSRQDQPFGLTATFQELNATTATPEDNGDLLAVPRVFRNNLDNTQLRQVDFTFNDVDEDHTTGQVDLKYNLRLGEKVNGFLKAGGKVRRIVRGKDNTIDFLRPYLASENPARDDPSRFIRLPGGQISLANFMGGPLPNSFLDGQYDLRPGGGATFGLSTEDVDIEAYNTTFGTNYASVAEIPTTGGIRPDAVVGFYDTYRDIFERDVEADLEDYDGEETVTAAYLMSEINLGKRWMLLGGVRMERTVQEYSARIVAAREEGDEEIIPDPRAIAAGRSYTEWLPMFHLKYEVAKWFDVRLAATKTLARPDFFNLVPWSRINNSEQEIDRGRPDLLNTTAWNYDLFLSFYNKFGLLTLGGFRKQLRNVDYVRTSVIFQPGSIFNGYQLTEPDNVPTTDVEGLEIDLQANLRPLKSKILRGIVFGGNITLLTSTTTYPFFEVNRRANPTPPPFFVTTVTDTLRAAPLVGQADLIANVNLGYEAGGFSGRLSATYQGASLGTDGVSIREEGDRYDDSFVRMDLALTQKIGSSLTLLLNVNNLLDTPERGFLFGSTRQLPTEEEFYGLTADLGFIWRFNR
ncbi:MAG: TonB-dependent receptor [Bacteroidota bacterium]